MKNGDKPAFARTSLSYSYGDGSMSHDTEPGLTKREYFIAKAMQGILANEELRMKIIRDKKNDTDWQFEELDEAVAKQAVKYADEVLKLI